MKKLIAALSLAVILAPRAFAQAGVLESVIARTDAALGAAKAAQDMPVFAVPAPVSISGDGRFTDTPAAEYLPLSKRAVYEYTYTSSEFPGAKTIRVEFMEYSEAARTVKVTPENFDVVQAVTFNDITPGSDHTIEIATQGEGNLMYQIAANYYLPWSAVPRTSETCVLFGVCQ